MDAAVTQSGSPLSSFGVEMNSGLRSPRKSLSALHRAALLELRPAGRWWEEAALARHVWASRPGKWGPFVSEEGWEGDPHFWMLRLDICWGQQPGCHQERV